MYEKLNFWINFYIDIYNSITISSKIKLNFLIRYEYLSAKILKIHI